MGSDVVFQDFSLSDDFGGDDLKLFTADLKDRFFMNECFVCSRNRSILRFISATEDTEIYRERFI